MKLVIDINENEFGIDIENKFQDFFKRLQAEIQSRLISNDTLVCGVYELETIEMFMTAFKNATIEKEPILDKIRAEIVDLGQRTMNDNRASGIWACRDILDKYKTKTERWGIRWKL